MREAVSVPLWCQAFYFREGQYEDKIIYSFAGDKARSFLRACREFLELNP